MRTISHLLVLLQVGNVQLYKESDLQISILSKFSVFPIAFDAVF